MSLRRKRILQTFDSPFPQSDEQQQQQMQMTDDQASMSMSKDQAAVPEGKRMCGGWHPSGGVAYFSGFDDCTAALFPPNYPACNDDLLMQDALAAAGGVTDLTLALNNDASNDDSDLSEMDGDVDVDGDATPRLIDHDHDHLESETDQDRTPYTTCSGSTTPPPFRMQTYAYMDEGDSAESDSSSFLQTLAEAEAADARYRPVDTSDSHRPRTRLSPYASVMPKELAVARVQGDDATVTFTTITTPPSPPPGMLSALSPPIAAMDLCKSPLALAQHVTSPPTPFSLQLSPTLAPLSPSGGIQHLTLDCRNQHVATS